MWDSQPLCGPLFLVLWMFLFYALGYSSFVGDNYTFGALDAYSLCLKIFQRRTYGMYVCVSLRSKFIFHSNNFLIINLLNIPHPRFVSSHMVHHSSTADGRCESVPGMYIPYLPTYLHTIIPTNCMDPRPANSQLSADDVGNHKNWCLHTYLPTYLPTVRCLYIHK